MLRFAPIFLSSLFISIHFGTTLYANSSILSNFFEPNTVSLIFLLGALGNILLFLFAPRLIRRFGKRSLLFTSLAVTLLGTLSIALANTATSIVLPFIVYATFLPMVFYCLDIFLEELSTDKRTGEIRGIYLTFLSLGIALGPLLLALLVRAENEFRFVYLAAVFLLLPPILFVHFSFKSKTSREHRPYHHSPRLPLRAWWQAKNIRHITLARLVLESFFAFMIIYIPIYLHVNIGLQWAELGIIFTVMLLPFVLFEWPAGELADRFWGEKELMIVGFLITGASVLIMPHIGKVFLAWMAILFVSRVGASLIESMTESYFFKHVEASDTGLISIFRLTRSVSYVFGAMAGTLTLNFFSFDKIFYVIAIVIFFGLKESLAIRDTL